MDIVRLPTASIKPYEQNAKQHTPEQIEQIANSIREFGFTQPCVVDEDRTLIVGHGRFEAAREAGYEYIPCIVAEGWSEAKKRAYRLADNQLNAATGNNKKTLKSELADLSIDFEMDMKDFGFDLDDIFKEKPPAGYKQTKNLDNFFRGAVEIGANEWGIPETKLFTDDLSGIEWVSFGEKAKIKDFSNIGMHFYIDDYKFESVWTTPDKWLDTFKQCRAVVAPDFSTYTDMSKAQQLWNHNRRQWCAQYWQLHGVNVISSLSWANGQLSDWHIAGIPAGTTVATSFVGDNIDQEESLSELLHVVDIVKPHKLFIKASSRAADALRKHLDFDLIPAYSFRG